MAAIATKLGRYQEDRYGITDTRNSLRVTDIVTDEMLAMAYMQFKFEGLLSSIFTENEPSLAWFIDRFTKGKGTEMLSLTSRNHMGSEENIALAWLNSRTSVGSKFDKMETGFAFYSRYHALKYTVPATQLAIEFAFRFLGIDSMFGTTPEHNRGAIAVARRAGFQMFGPIPHFTLWHGEPCGVMISSMTRERWKTIREKQDASM